jgi:alpha-glucosidase (family GH31 glycosyl hydrolase)
MYWPPVDTAATVESSEGEIVVRASQVDGAQAALRFSLTESGELRIAVDSDDETRSGRFAFNCTDDEAFFGLGAQSVGMDLRGRTYPLWTQEQGIGKPEGGAGWPLRNVPEASYAPMGIWHSSEGYTALVGHDGFHELSLCNQVNDAGQLMAFPGPPVVYLMPGETPADRLTNASERIGRPEMPPDWVYGPWNDAVTSSARVRSMKQLLIDEGIPSSAIWTEDWIGGFSSATGFRLSYDWSWSRTQYPDLPELIDELHEHGFAFMGYFNTFTPTNVPTFALGSENGWLVGAPDGSGEPYLLVDAGFRDTGLVDLSNPDAAAWFGSYMTTAANLGIDGWMADFTEWMPVDADLANGESGWEYHNRWPLDFQRLCSATLRAAHSGLEDEPSNNWTYFARSGWASYNGGTGGLAPVLWGGDQNTDWGYDDGLPTIVPLGVHSGLSGVALFASDIAGYSSFVGMPTTTAELFYRWTSAGAFHPVMRTHHGSEKCANWALDHNASSTQHFRRYAILHTMLVPYIREAMTEAVDSGIPVTRHPWLVETNTESFWRDDGYRFFLGEDILVQPVVDSGDEAGSVSVDVVQPSGGWWPLLGIEPSLGTADTDGVVRFTAEYEVTEIPAFVRPATALVMADPRLMTWYGPGTEDRPGVAQFGTSFTVALYPAADGSVQGRASGVEVAGTVPHTLSGWGAAEVRLNDDTDAAPACSESVVPVCRQSDGSILLSGLSAGDHTLTIGVEEVTLAVPEVVTVRLAFAGSAFPPDVQVGGLVSVSDPGVSWCDQAP